MKQAMAVVWLLAVQAAAWSGNARAQEGPLGPPVVADPQSQPVTVGPGAAGDAKPAETPVVAPAVAPAEVPAEIPVVTPGGEQGDAVKPVAEAALVEEGGRTLEWSLLGSGLVLAVAGGVFHTVAYLDNEELRDKYSNRTAYPCGTSAKRLYDQEFDELVQSNLILAYVLYGVGGGVFLAGLLLLDASSGGGDFEAGEYVVTPMVLPGGGGASVSFGW